MIIQAQKNGNLAHHNTKFRRTGDMKTPVVSRFRQKLLVLLESYWKKTIEHLEITFWK